MLDLREMVVTRQEELVLAETGQSELDEPRWSVVSFYKHEAGGLTYPAAMKVLANLDSDEVAGLCIVTDEAAARISR